MKNDVLFYLSSDVSGDVCVIDLHGNIDLQIKEFLNNNSSAKSVTLLQRAGTRTISSLTMATDAIQVTFDSPLENFIKHQVDFSDRPNGTLIINGTPILDERDLLMLLTITETVPIDFFIVSIIVNGEAHSVCMNCNAAKTTEFLKDLFTALNSPRKSSITYKKFSDTNTNDVSAFFILVWDENKSLAEVFIDVNDAFGLFNTVLQGCRSKYSRYALVDLADSTHEVSFYLSLADKKKHPFSLNVAEDIDEQIDYYISDVNGPTKLCLNQQVDGSIISSVAVPVLTGECLDRHPLKFLLRHQRFYTNFLSGTLVVDDTVINNRYTFNSVVKSYKFGGPSTTPVIISVIVSGVSYSVCQPWDVNCSQDFLESLFEQLQTPRKKSIVYQTFADESLPWLAFAFVLVWNSKGVLEKVTLHAKQKQVDFDTIMIGCCNQFPDYELINLDSQQQQDNSPSKPAKEIDDSDLVPVTPNKLSNTKPMSDLITVTTSELFGGNSTNASPRNQDDSINLQVRYLVNEEKSVSCAEPFTSVKDFVTALKSVAKESKTLAIHSVLQNSITSESLVNLLDGFAEIYTQVRTTKRFSEIFNCFADLAVKLQSNNFTLTTLDISTKCCHAIFRIPHYNDSYVILENSLVMLKCPSEVSKELLADVTIALQNNRYIISHSDEFSSTVLWPINPDVNKYSEFSFTFKPVTAVAVEGIQLFNVFCNGVRVRTLATPREIERFLDSLLNQCYVLNSLDALPSEFAEQFNKVNNGFVRFIPE